MFCLNLLLHSPALTQTVYAKGKALHTQRNEAKSTCLPSTYYLPIFCLSIYLPTYYRFFSLVTHLKTFFEFILEGGMHATAEMWKLKDNLQKLVLTLHSVGVRGQTQVTRLGSWCLSGLSHFGSPTLIFLKQTLFCTIIVTVKLSQRRSKFSCTPCPKSPSVSIPPHLPPVWNICYN